MGIEPTSRRVHPEPDPAASRNEVDICDDLERSTDSCQVTLAQAKAAVREAYELGFRGSGRRVVLHDEAIRSRIRLLREGLVGPVGGVRESSNCHLQEMEALLGADAIREIEGQS